MHEALALFNFVRGPDMMVGLLALLVIVVVITVVGWFRRKPGSPN